MQAYIFCCLALCIIWVKRYFFYCNCVTCRSIDDQPKHTGVSNEVQGASTEHTINSYWWTYSGLQPVAYLCTYTCHWSSSDTHTHRWAKHILTSCFSMASYSSRSDRRMWLFWSNRIVLGIYFLWPFGLRMKNGRL